jgi:hypothetical protein
MKAEIQANPCIFLTLHKLKLVPLKISENERSKTAVKTFIGVNLAKSTGRNPEPRLRTSKSQGKS